MGHGNESKIIRDPRFYAEVLILAFPLILQQLLRISVNTLDSIMLGSIDQIHMSAVSQAQQVFFIFYAISNGFAVGSCVLIAQYWGRKDINVIKTLIAASVKNAAVYGLVVAMLVFLFPQMVMRIYSSDPELIRLGAPYLRICSLMYIPCSVSTMLFAVCRGVEEVKVCFTTNMISYSLNIALNYCLIFGKFGLPELGIAGAAIGTVIARLVELFVVARFLLIKDKKIGFKLPDICRRDKALTKDLIRVTTPIVIHEIIWSTGTSASSMIMGQLSIVAVSAYNVAYVLYELFGCVMNGILNACSVTIAKTIGIGRSVNEIQRQAKSMLFMGFTGGAVLGITMLASKHSFLSLYNLTDETVLYAGLFITILALIWPWSGLEMTGMIAILRAGGDGKTGLISDIFTMWLITLPLAALAAFVWDWSPVIVISIIKFNIVLEALVGMWRVLSMKWIRDLTRHDKNQISGK